MTTDLPIAGYETFGEYVIETGAWGDKPTNPVFKWFGGIDDIIIRPKVTTMEEIHLKQWASTHTRRIDALVTGLKEFAVAINYRPQKRTDSYDWLNPMALVMGNAAGDVDTVPSFVLNRQTKNNYFVVDGLRGNTFRMSCSKGEFVNASIEAPGHKMSIAQYPLGSGSHAVDPGTDPLTWKDSVVAVDDSIIDNVREWSIDFTNNVKSEARIRELDPDYMAFAKPMIFKPTATLMVDFLGFGFYDALISGSEFHFDVILDGKTIRMIGAKFDGQVEYNTKPEDLIGERLPIKAKYVTII